MSTKAAFEHLSDNDLPFFNHPQLLSQLWKISQCISGTDWRKPKANKVCLLTTSFPVWTIPFLLWSPSYFSHLMGQTPEEQSRCQVQKSFLELQKVFILAIQSCHNYSEILKGTEGDHCFSLQRWKHDCLLKWQKRCPQVCTSPPSLSFSQMEHLSLCKICCGITQKVDTSQWRSMVWNGVYVKKVYSFILSKMSSRKPPDKTSIYGASWILKPNFVSGASEYSLRITYINRY